MELNESMIHITSQGDRGWRHTLVHGSFLRFNKTTSGYLQYFNGNSYLMVMITHFSTFRFSARSIASLPSPSFA